MINLKEYLEKETNKFESKFKSNRFWLVKKSFESGFVGLFDSKTKYMYKSPSELTAFLDQFNYLQLRDTNDFLCQFEVKSKRLWHYYGENDYSLEEGKKVLKNIKRGPIDNWDLPSPSMLDEFSRASNNPVSNGQKLYQYGYYIANSGAVDLDYYPCRSYPFSGRVFAVNNLFIKKSHSQLMEYLIANNLRLSSWDEKVSFDYGEDRFLENKSTRELVGFFSNSNYKLVSINIDTTLGFSDLNLAEIDFQPCRLPKLESAQLTDINKGLWELWGNDKEDLNTLRLAARNPMQDVHRNNVAIDFGTSSTVVALADEHGSKNLLRIGVRDFYQTPKSSDFENPTVLEILDFAKLQTEWTKNTYRPALNWNWVHASHEAQASFRDNPGDTAILGSILPKLKQWATRSEKETILLTDRQGLELTLAPLVERNPVHGEPMQVSPADPFDPIELYAWFLGMAINWRGRGLYLKYHLTFPVKYDRATKDKILASFRRGLQRSLPETLVTQAGPLQSFDVQEIASEPAAYAAAALSKLELSQSTESIPYAVFDFGGGTTDFDFGLWRWANEEEEEEGYEEVFEHIHSSGDNYLGGENLLDNLVYHCFQHNLDECRTHKINFTRPLDAARFNGDEAYIQQTQIAQTNTVLLAAQLRAFMESETGELDPQLKIDLLDYNGEKQACEFSLDKERLDQILFKRIKQGVTAFLSELHRTKKALSTDQAIHILLAGNGSRSRHIKTIFDTQGSEWQTLLDNVFGQDIPALTIHMPLAADESQQHEPTAKTGVALGLLHLCPGEGVKLIDHVRTEGCDEAPFQFYVGKMRRGMFDFKLEPSSPYQTWEPLGMLPQGVFKLCFSKSPRAINGLSEGDTELLTRRIDFDAAQPGDKLFARATGPSTIELAIAQDGNQLENAVGLRTQTFDLEVSFS